MKQDDQAEQGAGLEFVALDPGSVDVMFRTACGLADEGSPQEAESMLRSVLEKQPAHLPALLTLGRVLLEQEKADEAIAVSEKAAGLNPDIAMPFVNLAYAFILKEEYDQAISECEEAIFIDPSDPVPYGNLSLACLLKGDWAMCLKVTEKLLELDPASGLAHNNAAVACFRQGDLTAAVGHVKNAVDRGYPVDDGFLDEIKTAIVRSSGKESRGDA